MEKIVIEVKNIFKTFDLNYSEKTTIYETANQLLKNKNKSEKFNALTNVSFDIRKGEMVGIIGHNGSGKSTLLKIVCGILSPTKGSVKVEGKIVSFLHLGAGFHPDLSLIENIRLYGTILGIDKKTIESKIPKILEYSELGNFKDAKMKNLSSGMFARLAFATAIQTDPDIIIIDEVLSVGDIAFQTKSKEGFLNFKKAGKTTLYVTHSLEDIVRLCDRVILMFKGHVADIGKPETIVEKYKTVMQNDPDFEQNEIVKIIAGYYKEILKRDADVYGTVDFLYKIKKREINIEEIPEILKNSKEYKNLT